MSEVDRIGKGAKVLADRACREGQRRDAEREAARDEMYAQVARVYGAGDDGECLRTDAALRRARVEREGDPLGILRRPAAKETRHASGQAAAGVRKTRDALLRSSGTLKRLASGPKAVLRPAHLRTADELATLWEREAGGDLVRALDWTVERVDGGKGPAVPDLMYGVGRAQRLLMAVRLEVGARAFCVLHRMIVERESLTVIAIDLEDDVSARANGACDRRTRDHVSRMLREGLEDAGRVLDGARRLRRD